MNRAKEYLQRAAQSRHGRRIGIGVLVAFLMIGVLGFLAVPPLVRSLLQDTLTAKLHRPVTIGAVAINPYALSARLERLSIGGTDGETAGLDELYVNLEASSLFRGGPVVKEIRLTGPRVRVVREAEDRYNISDLLEEWTKPSDDPTPRFALNNIQVSGGRVEFDDRPRGIRHQVSDITLALPFVSSLPAQMEVFVEPAFSAIINGAPLALTGRSKPFAESHESELKLDLDRFDLARYAAYLPAAIPVAITAGTLDTDLKLVFLARRDGPSSATLSGTMALNDLAIQDRAGQPLAKLRRLSAELASIDPLNMKFDLGQVGLESLEGHVRVDRDGVLNWQALAGKPAPKATAGPSAKPAAWSLKGLHLADATLLWRDDSTGAKPQTVALTNLEATVGKLDSKLTDPIAVDATWSVDAGPRLQLPKVEVKGLAIDLSNRTLQAGQWRIDNARVALARAADGALEWLTPPRLQSRPSTPAESSPPWTVSLARLEATAAVRFEDRSTEPAATQVLENLILVAENLGTAMDSQGKIDLSTRINRKGELRASGSLAVAPAGADLKLDLRGLELLPLQPYFNHFLNITITRGQIAAQGHLNLALAPDGVPTGGFKGELTMGDLASVDKANAADFLKWKSLHLGGIDLKLAPFSLAMKEVALSDFFSRLIVSPEGKLNLMQIVRKEETASPTAPTPTADTPSQTATATPPAPAPAAEKPNIRIDLVSLQGGTVRISDNFIKPNYSARLDEIGGRVSGLSSAKDTAADMELRGAYEGAPVMIAGRLNPLTAEPTLDLKAEVRGVEMTPFSPYAGKYAGYAIDKGKLSLYLNYKIDNGQLNADNRIFLDQLTFGEKVESPDATGLPVTLAVALLKNRRGEIDINLPISGSLKDPEFSVGGIVVKVIFNLLAKAITSPFALLGSLFGGGEELSHIEFETGRAALTAASLKRLESLATALNDRPALRLEITGRVDPEADREGLKRTYIRRQVRAQKLEELVKKGQEAGSVNEVKVDDKEYPALLERAYKQEKFPKPRNFIGLAKSLPPEEMEKLMMTYAPSGEEDLRRLAARRGQEVLDWLVEKGQVPRERVFLLPPKIAADGSGPKEAKLSRAEFSLK